jgi:predicted RNase H-like HicB family nuclease
MASSQYSHRNKGPEHQIQPEAAAGEPLVEMLSIEGGLSDDFVLRSPVQIEVWQEGGEYVADVPDLELHAFGATREEALSNVRAAIIEQHQRFQQLQGRLSPLMQQDAARLAAIVLPRRA